MDVQEMLGGGLLSAYCGKFSPSDCKGVQIGTDEHCVQTILVFLQAAIRRLFIAELTLNNSKRVLHLTAHRGLSVLNISFPINCVIRHMRQFSGAEVNAVVDGG